MYEPLLVPACTDELTSPDRGVRYSVPRRISGLEVSVPDGLRVELTEESDRLRRAAQALRGSPRHAGVRLIEAIASSAIEGYHAPAAHLAGAVIDPVPWMGTDVDLVRAAISAQTLADEGHSPRVVSHPLLAAQGEWHAARAGAWRTENVRVGGHVAPLSDRVPGLMDDLDAFAQRFDSHDGDVVHAAIAHAQFETIHPFVDGNGRTGRALMSAELGLPVSVSLMWNKDAYIYGLTCYRTGDARQLVEPVLNAAVTGAHIVERYLAAPPLRTSARPATTAARLAAHLYAQPVVNAEYVARALGVFLSAAHAAINELVKDGTLVSMVDSGLPYMYEAQSVTALITRLLRDPRRGGGNDE